MLKFTHMRTVLNRHVVIKTRRLHCYVGLNYCAITVKRNYELHS